VAAYERAAAATPGRRGPCRVGGLYARQNDATQAIAAAEDALRIDPRVPRRTPCSQHLRRAAPAGREREPRGRGRPQPGIEHLQKASTARPYDVGLQLTLGRLYVGARDYSRAIDVLGGLVEREPGVAEASWWLAQAHAAPAGGPTRSTRSRRRGIRAALLPGLLMLAELNEQERRWREAASAYARAADQNPRSIELRIRQASALLAGGQAAEARDVLLKAAETNQTNGSVLYLLTDAQRTLKDFDAAPRTASA